MAWLETVYALVKAGDEDRALDVMYANVDRMLCGGDFAGTDKAIASMDTVRLGLDVSIGVLVATLAARHRLTSRKRIIVAVESMARAAKEDPAAVLEGLA